MAGVNLEGIKLRMTSRKNWLDQPDAPNLQTFSADARLNDRSGVGMLYFLKMKMDTILKLEFL